METIFLHNANEVKSYLKRELIIQEYFSFKRFGLTPKTAMIDNVFNGGNFNFKQGDIVQVKLIDGLKAKLKKNRDRRAKHSALTSLGLKRVKGSLGGVYYE